MEDTVVTLTSAAQTQGRIRGLNESTIILYNRFVTDVWHIHVHTTASYHELQKLLKNYTYLPNTVLDIALLLISSIALSARPMSRMQ